MGKAQAAMEYLMTYGWAILIVVVVVAALYAMGVFKIYDYEDMTKTCQSVCEAVGLKLGYTYGEGCNCVEENCVKIGNDTFCEEAIRQFVIRD